MTLKRCFAGLVVLVCLAGPAVAGLDAASINDAEWKGKAPSKDEIDPAVVKMQVLLDRAGFSPGEVDGKLGENALKALRAFAEAKRLAFDGRTPSTEIWSALISTSPDSIIVDYKITEKDAKGPFLEKPPVKMEDMKGLKSLDYASPREALAEKFHMSEALLDALNRGKKLDEAGQSIAVLNVETKETKPAVARVEVDKARQTVKVLGKSGELIEFFPATVGSREKPTPSGTLKITSIDANPHYGYNPDYKFKGVKSKQAFTINPGPNNPAGSYWIGLSQEGYGIHGTPNPAKISKAESHGCVRLTNWDAVRLAKLVKKGMEVAFSEGSANRK
jgi:lipoprotein-anchoring transpeptidase ErfK/SrfK